MREPSNPFGMRTSQHIESDASFLRLFSPGVLQVLFKKDAKGDLVPKDDLWNRMQTFQSAPGGGKTSLFRVFTPSVLIKLHESKSYFADHLRELHGQMQALDVLADDGPHLLSIMLDCARNYAVLEDLSFDNSRKEQLFYALLDARLTLATLRGALTLKKLIYPNDLHHLQITAPVDAEVSSQLPIPCSGQVLFEWARDLEKAVCKTLDGFGPASHAALEGHYTLHALSFIRPDCIICEGKPVADRALVMLDNFQKLAASQRHKLRDTLFDVRPRVGVWMAERLEALPPGELLGAPMLGATTGREYAEPIKIEDYWRVNPARFRSIVVNIAERRVQLAADVRSGDVPINSFAVCLQDSLEDTEWKESLECSIKAISDRVQAKWSSNVLYKEWIERLRAVKGTSSERAISWRQLEILIERKASKAQPELSLDMPLPYEELEGQDDSALKNAAEFLTTQEARLPYYYGMSRLAVLASSNIEQFLAFAGELFEEITAAALLKRTTVLKPNQQENILRRVTLQRWEEIPRNISNGRDVQKLLEAVVQCARWETFRPTAPYPPGVTGIALTMMERDQLLDSKWRSKHLDSGIYDRLLQALSSCISHNLLEASLDKKQGQQGKMWMILYLNRWLCLHFGLPLGYGGYRGKSPSELCKWLEVGFKPPEKNVGSPRL